MANIAVIIDDLFEDSEYQEPVKAFKNSGHKIIHVGLEKNKEVKGKKAKTPVKIEQSVNEVSVADFDALLIPGGFSPDLLRAHPEAVQFVKAFMDSNKPVFSICHGAQLLITAQTLKGRKATGWKSIVQDIKNAGAQYFDKAVVKDGNLITSRQPDDIPMFNAACLEVLEK